MLALLEHLAVPEETVHQAECLLSLMELPARLYCKHLAEHMDTAVPMALTEEAVVAQERVLLVMHLAEHHQEQVAHHTTQEEVQATR